MSGEARDLFLGIGADREATAAEVRALAFAALAEAGLAIDQVACIASIDLKAGQVAIRDLADELGVPVRFYAAARLEKETPRLATPSEAVFRQVGCHGVAEAAALAAGGEAATLAVPKLKSAHATLAVARVGRRPA